MLLKYLLEDFKACSVEVFVDLPDIYIHGSGCLFHGFAVQVNQLHGVAFIRR